MLENLKSYTKIEIGKRTFFQHMSDLRKEGLIKSIRRYGRKTDGKLYNRTSAVCITIKGYVQLALRGWKWALSQAKQLRKKLLPFLSSSKPEIIPQNIPAEKKEADTTKAIAQKVKEEGISLYNYLLKQGKSQQSSPNKNT